MRFRALLKRFGTDILGYACLLLVVVLGPLPGPGGIPLLIAGLGLLSVHNPWAKRLLEYAQKHSQSLRGILFPETKLAQILWDIVALVLLPISLLLGLQSDTWFLRTASISVAALSVVIALCNRSRIDALTKKRRR